MRTQSIGGFVLQEKLLSPWRERSKGENEIIRKMEIQFSNCSREVNSCGAIRLPKITLRGKKKQYYFIIPRFIIDPFEPTCTWVVQIAVYFLCFRLLRDRKIVASFCRMTNNRSLWTKNKIDWWRHSPLKLKKYCLNNSAQFMHTHTNTHTHTNIYNGIRSLISISGWRVYARAAPL